MEALDEFNFDLDVHYVIISKYTVIALITLVDI